MMLVVATMSLTFEIRGMIDADGDVKMIDAPSTSRNRYQRFNEDPDYVYQSSINIDAKKPKKIDNAQIFGAEEQRFNLFKAAVDGLYKAIRDADVKGVQQKLASGISKDSRFDVSNMFRQNSKSPTVTAFDCALEEKKPDVFVQRCEIFKLMHDQKPCYQLEKKCKSDDWKTSRPIKLLHKAAKVDSVAMVIFLLDSKISSISDLDDYERTALFFARSKEMVELLILRGVVHDLAKYSNGRSYRADTCPFVPEAIRKEIKRQANIEDTCCC